MADRIPSIPFMRGAWKPDVQNPGPMNTFNEWLSRVGRETPVLRRAVLDITTPAVGANAVVLTRDNYTANTTNAWGLTGSHCDQLVDPQFSDIIISHWYARPVWPAGLGAAPAVQLLNVQMYSVGQVQCVWLNQGAGAHAGGVVMSYEVILLRA